MTGLQRAAAEPGTHWRVALQQRFRQIMLARVNAHRAAGQAGPGGNHAGEVWPAQAFARLVGVLVFLISTRIPHGSQWAAKLFCLPVGVSIATARMKWPRVAAASLVAWGFNSSTHCF